MTYLKYESFILMQLLLLSRSFMARARTLSSPDAMKIVTIHIHETQEKTTEKWEATKSLESIIKRICAKRNLPPQDYRLVSLKDQNTPLDSSIVLGDLSYSEFAMILHSNVKTLTRESSSLKLAVWKVDWSGLFLI